MLRRWTWHAIAASVVLLGSTMAGPTGAHAVTSVGGRVSFSSGPLRLVDTREANGVPVAGPTRGPITLPSGTLLTVAVLDITAPGQVFVHPCASSPSASPAVFLVRPDEQFENTVITGTGPTCLSSTTPLNVVVDYRATVGSTPSSGGLQYVPLPMPLDVSPAQAFNGDAQIDLSQVPGDAAASVLGITVAAIGPAGFVTVYPCNEPRSTRPSDLLARSAPSGSVVVTQLSAPGATKQCVFASVQTVVQVVVLGYLATSGPDNTGIPPTLRWNFASTAPPGLDAFTPVRVLDTRESIGASAAGKLGAGEVQVVDLAPFVTIQTTAVVLNVTATEPDGAGFVTAFPCDEERPTVSNLNYVAGQTVPNLVTVRLGADASVCLFSQMRTHLVADLTGTYEFGGGDGAVALAPARLLDTREPIGVSSVGKLTGGRVLTLAVAGRGGVPADGVNAVTMNVTVVDPTADGFATVYPCDAPTRPTASNLNYVTGQTVANAVSVKLSAAGTVCIFTQSTAHVVADANAWYGPAATAGYEELTPARALDTRLGPNAGPVTGALSASGVLMPGQASGLALLIPSTVAGRVVLPPDANAVVLNVTATQPRGPGFLTVYPCGDTGRPTASNLNFVAGQTVANQVTVALGGDHSSVNVCFYSQQMLDVVVDVAGYYTAQPEQGWIPDVV